MQLSLTLCRLLINIRLMTKPVAPFYFHVKTKLTLIETHKGTNKLFCLKNIILDNDDDDDESLMTMTMLLLLS